MSRVLIIGWLTILALTASFAPIGQMIGRADEAGRSRLEFGQKPGLFTFTDIRYLPRTVTDLGKKRAYVIVFTTLDCPVVRRYLPRLKELEEQFHGQEVQFLALNVGMNDPLVEVAYQAVKADLAFPVGKDFDGAAAQALGVSRTPEVVVLDEHLQLRYRGRIDTQIRRGGIAPAIAREDLKEALQEILSDREVAVRETPVDGCLIEFDGLRSLPASVPDQVTFAEHVAPVLARHCQECHRPGTAAPFNLLTFSDAVAHAETIAEVVRQGQMPPMYASREHGEFVNLRSISDRERAVILAWVQQGKREGKLSITPAAQTVAAPKWQIGEPDLIIPTLMKSKIPATGDVPYQYAVLPKVFLHDTWVQGVEILPSNRSVMHHCNLGFIKPGEKVERSNFITGYVPGGQALILDKGRGYCIPAGSLLALQMHYVATGQPETDHTSVGLVFARETIQQQLRYFDCVAHRFAIPPGASHYPLTASRVFPCNATGLGLFSHMHLRGKDMVFQALYPDGRQETLLAIPNYDFNWQMAYCWKDGTQRFPKGTRVDVTAHYDNSPFNPYNPDPTATVQEGEQTYDEMMYGFLFYTDDDEQLNLQIDPRTGRVLNGPSERAQ